MRNLWLLLVAVLIAPLAVASDAYSFTVSPGSGASANAALNAPDGTGLGGFVISAQCTTGSARYRTCVSSSCAATSNDWLLPPFGMDIEVAQGHRYIAFYGEGGAATCRVYQRTPQPYHTGP